MIYLDYPGAALLNKTHIQQVHAHDMAIVDGATCGNPHSGGGPAAERSFSPIQVCGIVLFVFL